jgi:two-component system, OmpR family, sensor histidine kinase CpxA
MSRLYLKIFLWFWLTVLATAAALVIAFILWAHQIHPVGEERWQTAPFSRPSIPFIARQWTIALGVSGLVCLLMTRYLVAPILALTAVSRELADGNLTARVRGALERRRDEIGGLIRDFNAMASRLEHLVGQQRQLIFDMSHELRSPLARLNVALDLEREKHGYDPVLHQMEQDLNAMNEMIGRMLTVAKLDAYTETPLMESINVPDLVAEVVRNAAFEAQTRGVAIHASLPDYELRVFGDATLLYSAVENAVRNAIAYTDPNTEVEIHVAADGEEHVYVRVSDKGPGVPDSDLENIFRPFYRVDQARDRSMGGTGLGLAIADRVLTLHNGTVTAKNGIPRGLLIEMLLPLFNGEVSGSVANSRVVGRRATE